MAYTSCIIVLLITESPSVSLGIVNLPDPVVILSVVWLKPRLPMGNVHYRLRVFHFRYVQSLILHPQARCRFSLLLVSILGQFNPHVSILLGFSPTFSLLNPIRFLSLSGLPTSQFTSSTLALFGGTAAFSC